MLVPEMILIHTATQYLNKRSTRLRCVIQQETILDYIRTHILPLDLFGDLDFDDLVFENVRFDIVHFDNPICR